MIVSYDAELNMHPDVVLLQLVSEDEMKGMEQERKVIRELSDNLPFLHVALLVSDWNRDLTPWKAPALFGSGEFGGCGAETYEALFEEYLPKVLKEYDVDAAASKLCLGGYSLSGLFSLWAFYESRKTDDASFVGSEDQGTGSVGNEAPVSNGGEAGRKSVKIHGVAGVSPSVWYPGWMEHVCEHLDVGETILDDIWTTELETYEPPEILPQDADPEGFCGYLSLGKKEEHVRQSAMASVGMRIRQQAAAFRYDREMRESVLEWNLGNHFTEPDRRMGQAFAWLLRKLDDE